MQSDIFKEYIASWSQDVAPADVRRTAVTIIRRDNAWSRYQRYDDGNSPMLAKEAHREWQAYGRQCVWERARDVIAYDFALQMVIEADFRMNELSITATLLELMKRRQKAFTSRDHAYTDLNDLIKHVSSMYPLYASIARKQYRAYHDSQWG